ncbi:MAG: YggT family protein [Candidatus Eremiobacteraeota bacterium]|nr:YggT family protein [Candidatus Eremiobacteraeota bacterium]
MNAILCNLTQILKFAVNVYTVILFVYAVLSWLPDSRGRWIYYIAILVEPVLAPIRRIIPPIGGFDIAFLVLILLLQFVVNRLLTTAVINSCFRLY